MRLQRLVAPIALAVVLAGCASRPVEAGRSSAETSSAHRPRVSSSSAPSTEPSTACGHVRGATLSVFDADGALRWHKDVPTDPDGDEAAPVTSDGTIFSAHGGSVSALQADDGTVAWNVELGDSVYSMWIVDDTLVINLDQVSSHAKLVGLDPASGTIRWSYAVPGGGFMGNAVVTDDGALAFRTGDDAMLTVLDVDDGLVRWSRKVAGGRSINGIPAVADNLVVYVDDHSTLIALDLATGAQRWSTPVDADGIPVVSGDVVVVPPDAVSGPTISITAHSLADGSTLWSKTLADLTTVFPDQDGFLMVDYRAETVTLARPESGEQIWQAQLTKIENLDQPPVRLRPSGDIAVVESAGVAVLDADTGDVRQVQVGQGFGRSGGTADDLFVTDSGHVTRLTASGVAWTASVPHFADIDPTALDDGRVAVQTADPVCVQAW